MRQALAALALLVAIASAACGGNGNATDAPPTPTPSPTTTATPTPRPVARYDTVACPYDVPLGRRVECGELIVPENRSDPASRKIKLAVAVVRSSSASPRPDPIVYLSGGPGGSALETAYLSFDGWFAPFIGERDVVLFDQRGVGHSDPALDCEEFSIAFRDAAVNDVRGEALAASVKDALGRCHERLAGSGADLSGYSSAESAADLDDLRRALGYERWNLYGISYGTRLALTAMRDHPEGIRSVILDSSYPPQADLYAETYRNAKQAFDAFFAGCRNSPACNAQFPDLEGTFYRLVQRLNRRPARVEAYNPATDETIVARMSGDLLLAAFFNALYDSGAYYVLPDLITEASDGNAEALSPMLGDLFFIYDTVSIGMHYSVQCAEEAPFSSQGAIDAAARRYPRLRAAFDSEPIFAICETWGQPQPEPVENAPVNSDLPVLVLAGSMDPITPPRWGEEVASTLPRAFFYEFPGVGHGATVSGYGCPVSITLQFLERPRQEPSASCVSEMAGLPWR